MSHPAPPDAPIQWHEGMLLTPQHFQQAWLRQDALLHYHLGRLLPFHYGVRSLLLDERKLSGGIFSVLALEAVMPDGLAVSHPGVTVEDLETDLDKHPQAAQDAPFTVHLTVPQHRPGAAAGGELARYRSVEGPPVVDENTGDNGQSMVRLEPVLGLAVGDGVPAKYVALPLARIVRKDGGFQRVADYMAPTFAVTVDSPLAEECRAIAKRLRDKATYLAGRLRAPPGTVQAGVLADTRRAVQCLGAGLPQFEALLAAGGAHPFALHGALCGIAGQVAALGPEMLAPVFGAYDHRDILGSVGPVLTFIRHMIDSVSETYVALRFASEEAGFRLKIEPSWLEGEWLLVGVRLAPGQTEAEAEAWMAEGLIASAENMGMLRERRIRGAARHRVERDDRLGVVPERGVLLYRVTADPAWIEAERVLEIANPGERLGARRPAEIALFTSPPGGSAAGGPL